MRHVWVSARISAQTLCVEPLGLVQPHFFTARSQTVALESVCVALLEMPLWQGMAVAGQCRQLSRAEFSYVGVPRATPEEPAHGGG
jgi:hypothetical protein